MKNIRQIPKNLLSLPKKWWRHNLWSKLAIILVLFVGLFVAGMFVVAQWYIHSESNKPYKMGVSFIPAYAQSLGVDPEQTLNALLGLNIRHFRLVSYWDAGEPSPGQYDFSQLDWEFQKIEAAHGKVTLSIGMRQPRWPECHMPAWAKSEDVSQWQPALQNYMAAVINRYKGSPALDSYQVENEYFLKGFGECETIPHSMDRSRLVAEYNLVKKLDPSHTVIINRSNNALGWPVGKPTPDLFGISIYKRVWDSAITHRYLEYPFPSWFYGFVAGWQKLMTGHDMIIHELQAEAWAPNNKTIPETTLAEQNKSFNAERFKDRFTFARGTGMHEVYFWGAEYWYYRKAVLHDDTVWDVAHEEFSGPQQ
jgi:hypothetical protein